MATSHQPSSSVVVVMVPFPAQSHLNQLLQFCHILSTHDIPVHYVGSAIHNSQVKSRCSIPLRHLAKIQFHNFSTPPFPSSSPDAYTKTKFPEHGIPCLKATIRLRKPVAALFQSLSRTTRRLVVVYDTLVASLVQDVIYVPNAEAYCFNSASAFSCFAFTCQVLGRKEKIPIKDLPSPASCFPFAFRNFLTLQTIISNISKAGSLYNSCRAIEGSFLHEISANDTIFGRKNMWAVGPLHQMTNFMEISNQDKGLFQWLDKQERSSVMYISFGTTTTFSDEEIKQLAFGLEQSGVKFLWVLRGADKVDVFRNEDGRRPQLPDGFEERMRGMGIVSREWVPQVEILGHPSVGGFMSHCGWNSCIESISMGVPIAAWPIHSDQPMNAVLITKELKVGVSIMEWKQRDELVTSSLITKAVRKLMASKEGEEIRKRAEEMSKVIKRSVSEGGDSHLEWDSFVAHITREDSSPKNHKSRSFRLKVTMLVINFLMPFVFRPNVFNVKKIKIKTQIFAFSFSFLLFFYLYFQRKETEI